jgi:hypothetical protein
MTANSQSSRRGREPAACVRRFVRPGWCVVWGRAAADGTRSKVQFADSDVAKWVNDDIRNHD